MRIDRALRPNPRPRPPAGIAGMPIVVLGMHRSGTSAVTGMLEEQGIELGTVRRKTNPNQPKGNRENPKLTKLDERVLEYNDGAWYRPPERARMKFTRRHLKRRNRLLAEYEAAPFAIKDPRTLLLLDFWRDLLERPIGVIRNPLSVARSLRARGGPVDGFSDADHLELWKAYNRRLAEFRRDRDFPVIDFERAGELPQQVGAALGRYGIEFASAEFFEPGKVRHEESDWRARVDDREALELWEELSSYAS
jgi:hypothetical protein